MRIRLQDLNPPQREAVTTTDGPLLVLAGAGSGKTRVITYRIAYLLAQRVSADHILAVSFTNKAADEMRERLDRLVGSRVAAPVTLSTFHSLGLQILKAEKKALGFPGGFTIYDTADQLGVIREILREARIEDRRLDAKAILFRISRLKNAGLSPEAFVAQLKASRAVAEYDGYAAEVFPRYQQKLRGYHALDFDDLLTETLRLLRDHEDVRARWQRRFRYLMIDEYQDTNACQLHLLRLLCEPHRNLAVVGDDDQSIYGWRGAEAENILLFADQFPGAKVVKLEENYRSTQVILDAANAVIQKNTKRHGKTLWSAKGGGDRIQLVIAPDGEDEAKFVAEEIDRLVAEKRYDLRDIAVLYRSNIQARLIEEELRQARIDYVMIGGQAFFDRKEVKDGIAYLKLLCHPRDEISLRRVINYPPRGIGHTTLEHLTAGHKALLRKNPEASLFDVLLHVSQREAAALHAPSAVDDALDLAPRSRHALLALIDLLQRFRPRLHGGGSWKDTAKELFTEAGIFDDLIHAGPTPLAAQRRIRNLEGLLESLGRYQAKIPGKDADALAGYLHKLTLNTNDDDSSDMQGNHATLSTLHGAKGLEFKVVFLIGIEEEFLPHKRTLYPSDTDLSEVAGPIDVSEERRLFYVGITRARERLYLSRAQTRGSRNIERPRDPSRFLADIPQELLQIRDLDGPAGGVDAAQEEQFARQQLAKLLKMTE